MWWHKLIKYWGISDYAIFIAFNWFIVFGLSAIVRLILGRPFNFAYSVVSSFVMIPVSLLIIVAFQRYSSNTGEISSYVALLPDDFMESRLLRRDRSLVFFYADWCPFCRRFFKYLKTLSPGASYRIFRVDVSNENNPLWNSLRIEAVPTLIAFECGEEFWRVNGIVMIGLMRGNFERANVIMKGLKLEQ